MRQTILRATLVLGLLCAAVLPCRADPSVNVDSTGLAIKGYDPVAYFTDGKAEQGDAQWQSSYQGATYRFASAEHKAAFDEEPARYAPQFGGYCAYGVSQGHLPAADPTIFQIVDHRLLLQYNAAVRDIFNRDPAGNLQKADAYWNSLSARKGE